MPIRAAFTRTYERHYALQTYRGNAKDLHKLCAGKVLRLDRFAEGFGTLFTAEYNPRAASLRLIWQDQVWCQKPSGFEEGQRLISYDNRPLIPKSTIANQQSIQWARAEELNWSKIASDFAQGKGQTIETYLDQMCAV